MDDVFAAGSFREYITHVKNILNNFAYCLYFGSKTMFEFAKLNENSRPHIDVDDDQNALINGFYNCV